MLYFGYGSNLSADDLSRWCRERSLPPLPLTSVGTAFLPDRRLAFTHTSTARGGGVLDIPPSRGRAVAGVLFRALTDEAIATLDRKEAEGHAYRRIPVVALTDDGAEVSAFTYEVLPPHRHPFIAPSPSYLAVVRRGHVEHGLAKGPLEAAARDVSHAGPVDGVFVYGTLRRGEERYPALTRHGAGGGAAAVTAGTLLDLGPYPGLILDGPVGCVAGEIYTAPHPDALFAELDTIETFRGFGSRESLYRRAIVRVRLADGGLARAWTYVYAGPRDRSRIIASGDWHVRDRP